MATPFVQTDEPEWAVPTIRDADVPADLAALDQWVCWRRIVRHGKVTKVPFRADRPEAEASTTDRSTWSSFASALAACREPDNRLDGIGFVFTEDDPFVGIDLDDALSGGGEVSSWAEIILDDFPGYVEVTPSGRGLHIITRGECPGGKGRRRGGFMPAGGGVEAYDRGRYFTVTGHVFGGRSRVEAPGRPFAEVHAELFPERPSRARTSPAAPPPPAEDTEIVLRALNARNGDKFARLWGGDRSGYPSPSEADLALCSCLSFYSQDPATIDRLFRRSGLASEKWTGRADYRELTIARALERSEVYAPGNGDAAQNHRKNGKNPLNGDAGGNKFYSYDSFNTHRETLAPDEDEPDSWPPPRLEGPEPAAAFPLDAFPGPLAELASVAATCLGCPVDFPALAALGMATGAMGRSVVLKVKDGWVEAPALYAALVGDPGMTKSPAVGLMARPLWSITRAEAEAHRLEAEQARRERSDTPPPGARRVVVDDITVEKISAILQENPRGLVVVKDELSALFAGLNQYKGGGKGADRQFYLSAWSGSSIAVDRKSSPDGLPVLVSHPFLTVIGGMTPGMLSEMGEAKGRDDGFLDRLLFCCPEPVRVRWTDAGVPDDLALNWHHAIRRLWSAPMATGLDGKPRPHFVRLTPEATAGYAAWYDDHNRETEGEDFPAHLRGPWAKMRAYCARLALALDRLGRAFEPDGPGEPEDVGVESLSRAIVLMGYFKSHTRRVRSMMRGAFGDSADARALLRWAVGRRQPRFAAAEARKNFRRRFPVDGPELESALRWLEGRHCIRPALAAPRGGPGRPHSPEYELNPALLGGDMGPED